MFRRMPVIAIAATLTVLVLSSHLSFADMDGVVMDRGRMMMMKSGKPVAPMTSEVTMSNGAQVTTDGTVKMKDGRILHMKNGQMIMMDGKIMEGGRSTRMANPMP